VDELNLLRQQIDELDKRLLELFEARMERVQEVANFKAVNNLPILDASREKKVLEKTKFLKNPSLQNQAVNFLQVLMDISKTLQNEQIRRNKEPVAKNGMGIKRLEGTHGYKVLGNKKGVTVGFQGLPGSYSEQAVREFFGEQAQSINHAGFEDVFKALQADEIDYGVLPLENSFTGGIAEVYDLLCRYGFYIVGEKCVQVDHNLLALKGARLEDIREVYSHPQAFLQCSKYLTTHPEWNRVTCSNTAVSAKMIADSALLSQAAIASKRAAELYGLSILVAGINNGTDNFTRFIIIGRNPEPSLENNKISLAVAITHRPGSLHRILSHFAENGLNMLKIESRPIVDKTWEYLFYIDVEGNLGEQEVGQAIKEIKQESTYFKLLGNYCSDQR
jgi:chorismate mutase/prephenate dehydratase